MPEDNAESPETPNDETVTDPTGTQPSLAAVAGTGAALAALLGTRGAVGAGLAAGLAPGAAVLFQKAIDEWRTQQANRAGRVLQYAADEAELNVEDFLRSIGDDPVLLNLLFNTVQAAIRTNLDDKIRLLGKVLSNAISAPDNVLTDEHALLLAAVAELEGPHIEVLNLIAEGTERTGYMLADWRGVTEADIARSRPNDLAGIGGRSPLQPLLRVLERNGLIYLVKPGAIWDENMATDTRPNAGSNEWAISQFGQSILEMLSPGQDVARALRQARRRQSGESPAGKHDGM